MIHPRFMLCILVMCPAVIVLGGDIKDSLSTEKFENRTAERGDWSFQEGIASVVSDPELYKKYTNHGPILKWETNLVNLCVYLVNCLPSTTPLPSSGPEVTYIGRAKES